MSVSNAVERELRILLIYAADVAVRGSMQHPVGGVMERESTATVTLPVAVWDVKAPGNTGHPVNSVTDRGFICIADIVMFAMDRGRRLGEHPVDNVTDRDHRNECALSVMDTKLLNIRAQSVRVREK